MLSKYQIFVVVVVVVVAVMSTGTASSTDRKAAFATASTPKDSGKNEIDEAVKEVPLLPESDPNKDIPTIKLGETIKFEEMGPVIINLDGSTRRIDNWDEMTDKEREVAWRRISKRNEERRKMLLEKMEKESEEKSSARNDDL
mmetsp:Transcript_4980/g.7812  ORF Transcript_4980/g.7812 Transcript_4980/m.7812 type:complete len:143 (+) Transcript_4980:187-615(+)